MFLSAPPVKAKARRLSGSGSLKKARRPAGICAGRAWMYLSNHDLRVQSHSSPKFESTVFRSPKFTAPSPLLSPGQSTFVGE